MLLAVALELSVERVDLLQLLHVGTDLLKDDKLSELSCLTSTLRGMFVLSLAAGEQLGLIFRLF